MSANRGGGIVLTDRQLQILRVLIDDYIQSAEPVGSQTISKHELISYSPATIRNDLADLEELGLLQKTHSSSGRIPSEKGYRFYVDHLMSPLTFTNEELANIQKLFTEKFYMIEKVIQQSAIILSELTNYTSIILGPELNDTKLKHLQIVPLSNVSAVAIIVTDTGHVENKVISLPDHLDLTELEKIINILNDRLVGVPLIQLQSKMFNEIESVLKVHVDSYEQVMKMLTYMFTTEEKIDKVYYGGKTNILAQPEFRDLDTVRQFLDTIEKEELIYQLVNPDPSKIEVKIGQENELQAMKNCSVITTAYSIGGQKMGSIAIVGPIRMDYERVISLLDFLSKDLTKVLTSRYHFSSNGYSD